MVFVFFAGGATASGCGGAAASGGVAGCSVGCSFGGTSVIGGSFVVVGTEMP